MRRKRYATRQQQTTFALNITSLTDMFTILLVFLLQTYSTSDSQITPEKDLNLPVSNSEASPQKSFNISCSRTELKIEGRTIASLNEGVFVASDLETSDTNFIKPLFKELQALPKNEGKIFLQADQNLSYDMLRKVMYTASMAGFPQLKLAAISGE